MSFDAVKPLIGQAVRWIVPFVLGKLGYDAVSDQAGEIAGAAVVLVTFGLSLLWSRFSDKKVVEKAKQ